MRAVVQRVASASVAVAGERMAAIGRGLLVLVGVARGDGEGDAATLADKVARLRLFPDEEDRMNRSVVEVGGSVLVVSQFTLLAEVRRGRRPSFTDAAPPEEARPLVEAVAAGIAATGVEVRSGVFGERMAVESVNDGPVTVVVEVRQGRVT